MRLSRALIPLAAASLVLSACGGSTNDKPGSSPQHVSAGTTLDQTWPLTGLKVTGQGSAAQKHPVYIAKIDNTQASQPQYGVGDADLVTQELVEGGVTRLAVFYYSKLPDKVGPIRSMRLTDIGVAKPLNAQLVTSGAAPVTIKGLKKAGVKFIDMNNPNVRRVTDGTHDTLHSVRADLGKLGSSSGQKSAERPADFLQWGTGSDFKGRIPARTVDTKIGNAPGSNDIWKYVGGKYVLQDGYMDPKSVFKPDTVIAITVKTSLAPYRDPAGNPVPVTHFEGKGKAVIFHGGKALHATWVKNGVHGLPKFKAKNGSSIKIPAGHVWLALVPQAGDSVGAGSVTWTKK